jgi:sarcosine oxidase, subunit beta
MKKYNAIIIGAGITGASIAYELSKKGYRTLNVDSLAAAGLGSTANTCAIIRTHYSTLEGTAIAYESYFSWKDWKNYINVDDEKGLAEFCQIGLVNFYPKEHYPENHIKHHDKMGIPYEIWDIRKLLDRMPHFIDDSFFPPKRPEDPMFNEPSHNKLNDTVVYYPNDGYINDPVLSVHNVQRAAEAKGATFRFGSKVIEITKKGDQVTGVTLDNGDQIPASIVVNAAGPHSGIINRIAGVEAQMKIKTRPLRHEVHFVPSPENFSYEKNGMVVGDGDLGGYHRPETGNLILVGSEDPECDEHDWIEDPDNYNQEVTLEQYQAQTFRLAKRIPDLRLPNSPKGIADLYDVTDDWIPIYDRSDLGGFYLAIGTSGNQYKNGPAIGQIMANIIAACENGHDHDQEPVQVDLNNINFSLNTGIFSRNREINKNSSFSVLG